MYFKDEGFAYTYKLLADGSPSDPNEMYEIGSLETKCAMSKKQATEIAKKFGLKAVFG
jgi:hypothetical protein